MDVDGTIAQVERLYRSLTGKDPSLDEPAHAGIPPEKDPHRHVEEQLDRLREVLGRASAQRPAPSSMPWIPQVSMIEHEREIVVCVELPGVPRDAVNVAAAHNLIVVSGQRQHLLEGPFHRVIGLPPGVQLEQLAAELKDGLLVIRAPRALPEAPATKAIPVK